MPLRRGAILERNSDMLGATGRRQAKDDIGNRTERGSGVRWEGPPNLMFLQGFEHDPRGWAR